MISTPVIWIAIPIVCSIFLVVIKEKKRIVSIIGGSVAFLLFLLAVVFPKNLIVSLGSRTFEFSDSVILLGRSITINSGLLPFVALAYLITSLWLYGSGWFSIMSWFCPLSMLITPILIFSLAVQPFLYAALLIELAILLSVPILSPIKIQESKGTLRFLIFNTLAMPMILISGWMLSGIDTVPTTNPLVLRATIFLLLGFALWLAIFPFHSWLPLVYETGFSWQISFINSIMPITFLMFLLTFFDRYAWLRSIPNFYNIIDSIGVIMIVVGSIFLTIQTHIGRAFGYAVMIETGFSLLAIGLAPQGGLNWLFMSFLPRILSYWLWSFSMSAIQEHSHTLSISSLKGYIYHHPFQCVGILIGQLSLAGLPLLASFPAKRMIWFLTTKTTTLNSILSLFGSLSIILFSLNLLIRFLSHDENEPDKEVEKELIKIIIPICFMILVSIFVGLFPHWFYPFWMNMINAFPQILLTP